VNAQNRPREALPATTEDQAEIILEDSQGRKPPEGRFDLEFRHDVAQLILETLKYMYDYHREKVTKEAYRRRMTVEQLVAATLAQQIMDKVDREYI
jgi:hypothetical protein